MEDQIEKKPAITQITQICAICGKEIKTEAELREINPKRGNKRLKTALFNFTLQTKTYILQTKTYIQQTQIYFLTDSVFTRRNLLPFCFRFAK